MNTWSFNHQVFATKRTIWKPRQDWSCLNREDHGLEKKKRKERKAKEKEGKARRKEGKSRKKEEEKARSKLSSECSWLKLEFLLL